MDTEDFVPQSKPLKELRQKNLKHLRLSKKTDVYPGQYVSKIERKLKNRNKDKLVSLNKPKISKLVEEVSFRFFVQEYADEDEDSEYREQLEKNWYWNRFTDTPDFSDSDSYGCHCDSDSD